MHKKDKIRKEEAKEKHSSNEFIESREYDRNKYNKSPLGVVRPKPPIDKSELKSLSQIRKERKMVPPAKSSNSGFK